MSMQVKTDIDILEDLMMKRNYVLNYNPILNEPLSFFLNWLEKRCYRIMIVECIQYIHHNIEPILQKVKDLDDLHIRDEYGKTWLHTAVEFKNYKAIQILLEFGINPEKSWYGKNALMQAVLDNDLAAVEIFLKKNVHPDMYSWNYRQPLYHIAKDDKYIDIAKLLLKYGSNQDGYHLSHPINKAIKHKQPKMKALLMEHGCKTDFSDEPKFVCYQIPAH